jgi:hypothetical protein
LQVGDTGPVESARRSNSRVLGSPFSGLSGQAYTVVLFICTYFVAWRLLIMFAQLKYSHHFLYYVNNWRVVILCHIDNYFFIFNLQDLTVQINYHL